MRWWLRELDAVVDAAAAKSRWNADGVQPQEQSLRCKFRGDHGLLAVHA